MAARGEGTHNMMQKPSTPTRQSMPNGTPPRESNLLHYAFGFGIAALLAGLAGWWLKADLTFKTPDDANTWLRDFWGRFQMLSFWRF
jgi:hypothetical protein